jgi:Kef-type K+ transport system membrane component KefB
VADLIAHSVFAEFAALLVLAGIVGALGLLVGQPLVVSFIAVGILAGPAVLGIVRSGDPIRLLSELGIAVLLFLVGIKLDVSLVRRLGLVSLATGLGQVGFTALFGLLIALGLGYGFVEGIYIGVALTFSSTIIIVKLLSDKREIDSLHGQIAVGFLIVQDLVVVLAMIVLAAVGIGSGEGSGPGAVLRVLAAGGVMLAAVILFVRYAADPLMARVARSPELLLIVALALAALFAALGDALGLGKEVGGLMAGVALASTPYRDGIALRMAPLRDFLLLFFFIALGAGLDLSTLGEGLVGAVVFSVFVLVGNPLIVLAIMGLMGYRSRTGFLAGLTVAQISEFSLIFTAMGVALGHVGQEVLGLVTLVGLVTIAASTYMITYSHELHALCRPLLGPFERRGAPGEARFIAGQVPDEPCDVILIGLGRYGTAIGEGLAAQGLRVLGVDFNPDAVARWRQAGHPYAFGDATDPSFIEELPLAGVRWVVSTIPAPLASLAGEEPPLAALRALREAGYEGRIAVAVRDGDGEVYIAHGADIRLDPFREAAERAVERIAAEPAEGSDGQRPGGTASTSHGA